MVRLAGVCAVRVNFRVAGKCMASKYDKGQGGVEVGKWSLLWVW